ncbi:MAG: serine protease [Rhodospirillaceae bacterium]|nr:serine protease [Rhodospirillaceae bacterium]
MRHNCILVNKTPEGRCTAGVAFLRIFLCFMLLVFFYCYKADAKALPESFAGLAAKLLPSVVNISTTQIIQSSGNPRHNFPQFPPGSPFEEFFKDFMERNGRRGETPGRNEQNPKRRARSLGSGFIIDSSGIIVTNNHVIAEADEIKVRLQDDTEFEAEILGRDPKTDIAVLRIKPGKSKLVAVEFGDSDKLRVGDWVVAIGNPFGLGGTVTAGIVSARGRDINQGPYDDFIQTDASINKGNSGGPLFNLNGKVIGINTAIFSQSGGSVGIGFAVASRLAKPVVKQLKDFGRTRRGWLGVRIQMVTDEIAESFGLKDTSGALVAEVSHKGPAKKAGIKPGDVILTFNGKKVESMRRLPRIVAETPIGIDVPVILWRAGRRIQVMARIGELEEELTKKASTSKRSGKSERNQTVKLTELGMTLGNLNDKTRKQFSIESKVAGVAVIELDRNGLAAEKGVRTGDVIIEVDQKAVSSASEVQGIVLDVVKKKIKKSVLFTINRRGSIRFLGLRVVSD